MTREEAFDLMRAALTDVLPVIENLAKHAKSPAAKKNAAAYAAQIKAALEAAREV